MKKAILFVGLALGAIACGSGETSKNRTEINATVSPQPTSVAAVATPTTLPSDVMPEGIKVVKVQTVKFNDGKLDDGWQWLDPDGEYAPTPHEFKNGRLMMTIPTTKDLYGENRTAPRFLKAVSGDFQIETHVKFDPSQDYQGAGLLIYKDAENYIRLERAFGGTGGGGSGLRLDTRMRGEYNSPVTPIDIPTTAIECDLKITRRLNVFSIYWREDENTEWRSLEDVETVFPETIQAGVLGCNTATEIAAEFSNIRLSPQPLQRPY